MTLSAIAVELLARIPGPATAAWPHGERFARAFAHGTMSVELYAPLGSDPQSPHEQDELYIVQRGVATLVCGDEHIKCEAGTVHFVPAGADHHFESFTQDFCTWVVFWGPKGGESAA